MFFSVLILITIYYISYGFVQIIVPINRVSMLVINKTPMFDYMYDLLIVLVLTFIISFILDLNTYKLVLLMILEMIGFYLLSIGMLGGLLLLLSIIIIAYHMDLEREAVLHIVIYLLSLLSILEVVTVISILVIPMLSGQGLISLLDPILLRERSIWSVIEYFSIILFIAYVWINLLLYLDKVLKGRLGVYNRINKLSHRILMILRSDTGSSSVISGYKGLLLGLLFVFLLIAYLHSPIHNPDFMPISVDTFIYWRFFRLADNYGLEYALVHANYGRPAYLVFLYWLYSLIHDPVLLMDVVHPLIALSLLVVAVYLVAYKYYGPRIAGYSALFTAIGHSCITFIAGGYQANALALAFSLLWLYFYPEKPIIFTILSLFVVLIHPWTFIMYSAIIIGYYVLINRSNRRNVIRLLIILAIVYIVGEIIDRELSMISPVVVGFKPVYNSLWHISIPSNWISVFEIWTWGSQGNSIVLLLSLPVIEYSFVSLSLALLAPTTIFTGSLILYRLLLNTPIEILAAETLSQIDKRIAYLLTILALTKTLIIAYALTPLTTYPWINILK